MPAVVEQVPMRAGHEQAQAAVLWLDRLDRFAETNRERRVATCEGGLGTVERSFDPDGVHQFRECGRGGVRIELCRRLQVEPADVLLPEGTHGPRHLAVALADAQLRRQLDL